MTPLSYAIHCPSKFRPLLANEAPHSAPLSEIISRHNKCKLFEFASPELVDEKNQLLHVITEKCTYILCNTLNYIVNEAQNTQPHYYFIRIETLSLMEPHVIRKLIKTNKMLKVHGGKIIIEVIERNSITNSIKLAILYQLIDSGIEIALNRYNPHILSSVKTSIYSFLKIDIMHIRRSLEINEHKYLGLMLHLEQLHKYDIQIIITRINDREDFSLAKTLPFNFFHGSYFDNNDFYTPVTSLSTSKLSLTR